jgi:hypothetical protein
MENVWLNKVHFTSAISSSIEIPPQFEFCFRQTQRYQQQRFHKEERHCGPLLHSHGLQMQVENSLPVLCQ